MAMATDVRLSEPSLNDKGPDVPKVKGDDQCLGMCEEDNDDIEFGCVLKPALLAFLVVVCGTASTITGKLQYSAHGHGRGTCGEHPDDDNSMYDDDPHESHRCKFEKPWFQTLVMKIAMALCLFIAQFAKWKRHRDLKARVAASAAPGLQHSLLPSSDEGAYDAEHARDDSAAKARAALELFESAPEPTWRSICFIAIPAATDLLQTVLSQAGLLWVSSSTYQMTRGSVIIFTCAFSVMFMGKVLTRVHVASIGIVCVAIILVGLAGVEAGSGGSGGVGQIILGLMLILVGQVIGAVQFVLEELVMETMHITPTLLVGWEGAWGVLMFCALGPILTATPSNDDNPAAAIWHEDFIDSIQQTFASEGVALLTGLNAIALLVYNLVGNMVTKQLSAVMRSILESCRTLGVWLTSLVLWYAYDNRTSGERWSQWSYMELVGFFLLCYGTVAYKEILPIPCLSKAPAAE